MSFIAPQAYTKETLAKAFDWLQHQPANLKQVATSPDVLVGLYLKAQRQGLDKIDADAPVSSRKFFDDLKSLKKDFAIFDEPKTVNPSAPPQTISGALGNIAREIPRPTPNHPQVMEASPSNSTSTTQTASTTHSSQASSTPPMPSPIHATQHFAPAPPTPFNGQAIYSQSTTTQAYAFASTTPIELPLDEASLEKVEAVRQRFNLSTQQEAVRMLIAVGHKQIGSWP